jgi:hypothetical protein
MTKLVWVGDIVQANPETSEWGPSLVVVSEVKSFGIQGYTHIPRGGDAFIRLTWDQFDATGGRAVWDHERSASDEA